MVTFTMSESSPSKMVHITIPGSGGGYTSPRPESISAKMKKILTSPKGNRGKAENPPYKTFGVLLEYLFERDNCEVPRIVSRLCEYLKQNGMRQEGLFRVNGNIKVVDRLKNLFDKNGEADLEDIGDVPACASLLKMFLRELADPVIPDDLQPQFINLQHKYCQDKPNLVPRVKELVQRMPQLNRELLKYLSEFMLFISKSSDGNKMTPLALAIVFGPNIFRCGEGLNGLRDQAYVNAVLLLMLQEFDEIFGVNDSEQKEQSDKQTSHINHTKKTTNQNTSHMEHSNKTSLPRSPPDQKDGTASKSPSLNKNRPMSQVRNSKSPNISLSPTHSVTSTKQSKQLVENTINIAVKELLFGPGMVSSSCESDRPDDTNEQMKNYPFEMSEETLNEGLICQTRRTRSTGHKKERRNVYDRCMSSPPEVKKNEITDEDLEFVGGVSKETLKRLTDSRVQPPQNRRKPSFRNRSKTNECCGNETSDTTSPKGSTTNNTVNNEYVHNQYEMNSNDGNKQFIDTSRVRANHDNDSKQLVNKNQQIHNDMSPLQQSPVTSKRKLSSNTQHTPLVTAQTTDVRRLPERCEVDSPPGIHTSAYDDAYRQPSPSSPDRRQDSVQLGEMSPPSIKRKIASLKKVISNLEANFEETNGRKPKPSEKGQIQKYMQELTRAKKQLKEVLVDHRQRDELSPEPSPTIHGYSNPSIGPTDGARGDLTAKEETLSLLMKKLQDKRLDSRRPEDIMGMTSSQLKDEKLAVQKALLMYENQHGRPTSKEDKTLMRPLYDRYRKIKRLIATGKPEPLSKQCSTEIESNCNNSELRLHREDSRDEEAHNELNSRVPRYPLNSSLTTMSSSSHQPRPYDDDEEEDDDGACGEYGGDVCETFLVTNRLHDPSDPTSPSMGASRMSDDAILHDATVEELMEQQRLTKRTKKRLGKLLKDFEEDFFNKFNHKVQKNDRLPKQAEYREYKLIKAKLRLIEALIEKKKVSVQ